MTNATITKTVSEALAAVRASGKTPWVIFHEGSFEYVYSGRTEARAAKAIDQKQGTVMKADDLTITIVEPFDQVTEKEHAEHRGEIIRHSTTELPCQRVFIIADQMIGARRKDVVAACVAAGVAYYTARTQYQHWLTARKEMLAREAAKATK